MNKNEHVQFPVLENGHLVLVEFLTYALTLVLMWSTSGANTVRSNIWDTGISGIKVSGDSIQPYMC